MHGGDLNVKEVQKRGTFVYVWLIHFVCMADPFCCTVETITTLQSNYAPIKFFFKSRVSKERLY